MKKICVIGLGYVGTPLLLSLKNKGFEVFGLDKSINRINDLRNGIDLHKELDDGSIETLKNIVFNSFIDIPSEIDIYIVTVPTPIDESNNPDMQSLITVTEALSKIIKKGNTIIYESTVYPGTTEEICLPILEKSGLSFNKDFFLGYSPERLSPGIGGKKLNETVKIISASNKKTLELLKEIYGSIIDEGLHFAESIKVAEAAKITENIQRDVNIALVNELFMLFESMGINTNQVINAASTKFNFHYYIQGLVGGHCIGVDPYYLIYKSKAQKLNARLIETARDVNESLVNYLVVEILNESKRVNLDTKEMNLLFIGATFKEDCPDTRNSKSIELIKKLKLHEINVNVYDPLISENFENISFIRSKKDLKKDFYDTIFYSVCHREIKELGHDYFKKFHNGKMKNFDYKRIFIND